VTQPFDHGFPETHRAVLGERQIQRRLAQFQLQHHRSAVGSADHVNPGVNKWSSQSQVRAGRHERRRGHRPLVLIGFIGVPLSKVGTFTVPSASPPW
jgi:hypothetical protein